MIQDNTFLEFWNVNENKGKFLVAKKIQIKRINCEVKTVFLKRCLAKRVVPVLYR